MKERKQEVKKDQKLEVETWNVAVVVAFVSFVIAGVVVAVGVNEAVQDEEQEQEEGDDDE